MMHISQKIIHNIEKASATDTITLDYEGRFLRRKRVISDNGEKTLKKDWASGARVKFFIILHFYFQIEKKTSENSSNDVKPVCFRNISKNFSLGSFSY